MNTQKFHRDQLRTIFIAIITLILIGAVITGVYQTLRQPAPISMTKRTLENVRDYAASTTGRFNYAVDGGTLFYGNDSEWTEIATPEGVIVSAVALDSQNEETIYIGAANELTLYRSTDAGQRWVAQPLSNEQVGGVTDIAVDSFQRLVYVGTDTAGLFRLRERGPSLTLSSHLLLDTPVIEVATDSTGAGLAFARTAWHLYRTSDYGINWSQVDDLSSVPTALVVANTTPATVYIGTTDRGVLKSQDGVTWSIVNQGLGATPGSRLMVDALAVDPTQPSLLYVATSYLFGTTTLHQSPAGVFMNEEGADQWSMVSSAEALMNRNVAELLPVSGQAGAVYALTMQSRSPMALGNAPVVTAEAATPAAVVVPVSSTWGLTHILAWVIAGLALGALIFAIVVDIRRRRSQSDAKKLVGSGLLEPSVVRSDS